LRRLEWKNVVLQVGANFFDFFDLFFETIFLCELEIKIRKEFNVFGEGQWEKVVPKIKNCYNDLGSGRKRKREKRKRKKKRKNCFYEKNQEKKKENNKANQGEIGEKEKK